MAFIPGGILNALKPSCPSLPKLTKGQKIGAGVGAAALAVILALGATALVMHSQGTLMGTLAQIKATTVTAATATGALATKVGAFIKAHYHYFISGGAAVGMVGLGVGVIAYQKRAEAKEAAAAAAAAAARNPGGDDET